MMSILASEEPKYSVLQANAQLAQKEPLNQRSRGSILTGVTFCYLNILFSYSKASDANIDVIADFV